MKLAILLPGQPRQLKVGYESLKKFYLDKYECDIFIHTWFDTKFDLKLYGEMIQLYKPKKILIEQQIPFANPTIKDPTWQIPLNNLLSMYYSMMMANQLKQHYQMENGFVYDYGMKMRSDLEIIRPIEIEKIEKDHLALYNWTEMKSYKDCGISDVFAIGTSQMMDAYADLYTKTMYYLNEDKSYDINQPKMRGEYILQHHLKTIHKIPLQFFHHNDQNDPSFRLVR